MIRWLNFLCPWYVIWSYLLFDNIYLFFISHEHSSWQPEMWNVAFSIQMKNKKKSSNIEIKLLKSCCQRMVFLPNCARLLFPHFFIPSLISNNAVSSDYPNASQAPFVANQRTNHLLISQSFLNDHCPALSKWMANQRNHQDWNDGPSHRIVWPMVDNHLGGPKNHRKTIEHDGCPQPFHSMVMVALKTIEKMRW